MRRRNRSCIGDLLVQKPDVRAIYSFAFLRWRNDFEKISICRIPAIPRHMFEMLWLELLNPIQINFKTIKWNYPPPTLRVEMKIVRMCTSDDDSVMKYSITTIDRGTSIAPDRQCASKPTIVIDNPVLRLCASCRLKNECGRDGEKEDDCERFHAPRNAKSIELIPANYRIGLC